MNPIILIPVGRLIVVADELNILVAQQEQRNAWVQMEFTLKLFKKRLKKTCIIVMDFSNCN
jgi:hypothetical protein